jgi:hypothetical protein
MIIALTALGIAMDLRSLSTHDLLFNLILYVCMPAWLIFGFIDYYCHRKSKIEETTGWKESVLHAIMGLQVGIPVFLGLFFIINPLIYLIMFGVLIAHEWVAHHDVKYALNTRPISILETHAHSFLEVLPFVIVALIICIDWGSFVDLITFQWGGRNFMLIPKEKPLDQAYVAGYIALLLIADVLPYFEEFMRCWRKRDMVAKT